MARKGEFIVGDICVFIIIPLMLWLLRYAPFHTSGGVVEIHIIASPVRVHQVRV